MKSLSLLLLTLAVAASAFAQAANQQNPMQPGAAAQQPSPQPGKADAGKQPEPTTPHTVTYDDAATKATGDAPLFETAPLPTDEALTLIGGRVEKIDRVRNRLTVRPFGKGAKLRFEFDERSRILRDGVQTTQLGIREGDRVYIDSMLMDDRLFAKSIRVQTQGGGSDANGQLVRFDAGKNLIVINDPLASRPVSFRVDDKTRVRHGETQVRLSDLQPGSLLTVKFAPERGGSIAREIEVRAMPGQQFQFLGRITHVDLRVGLVVLQSETDSRAYEIRFTPGRATIPEDELVIGARISTSARFNGSDYRASEIQVLQQASPAAER